MDCYICLKLCPKFYIPVKIVLTQNTIPPPQCQSHLYVANTPIPLDGVSATIRNFSQNDTKRDRNAKSAAETPRAQ